MFAKETGFGRSVGREKSRAIVERLGAGRERKRSVEKKRRKRRRKRRRENERERS